MDDYKRQEITRRRELLTRRLEEQINNYNKNLVVQNFNFTLFAFLGPVLFGGIFFLLGYIFKQAVNAVNLKTLVDIVDITVDFMKNNHNFHMVIISLAILFIIGVIIFHFMSIVNLNQQEISFAGYILATLKKDMAIKYEVLHKEIEFRSLTYAQFDKVMQSLKRLDHLVVEYKKEGIEKTIIIRKSDW